MLQRYLLIGVGGSGGKTLRYIWRELDRRLDGGNWGTDRRPRGVPEAWSFLHVDVPEMPDVVEGDVPAEVMRSNDYLGLARAPRPYRDYDAELLGAGDLRGLVGWRPDPTDDYPPVWKGAGQRRVIGRVITLVELDRVGHAIDAAVTKLASADVEESLRQAGRALGEDPNQKNTNPATVIVVSSLAGGSGSGAFLDVVELLKSRATEQAQWLNTSLLTVLYGADLFGHLMPEQRTGVEPNSLAAISELLAAFEHDGVVPEDQNQLLRRGGGTVPVRGRRVGDTNFIIGARNETVKFGTSAEVFRSTAKAIATFMTNDRVQHQFYSYIETNKAGARVAPGFAFADEDATARPCSSFGYSSVSLGRPLFQRYAYERLAKLSVEKLLRGHHEERSGDDDFRKDEALVDACVDRLELAFFQDCRLSELGEDENQVLDDLRLREEKQQALHALVRTHLERLRSRDTGLAPSEWLGAFKREFNEAADAFERKELEDRKTRSMDWVDTSQALLREKTASYAGKYGFLVTIELLKRLERQLEDAADELDQSSAKKQSEEGSFLSQAANLIGEIKERIITPRHERFEKAAMARGQALSRRTEASLHTETAKLLREFRVGVIPALRAALEAADGALRNAEDGEHRQLVAEWSSGPVPRHLVAAPNELLLEKQEDFPSTFEKLLQGHFSMDRNDAISAALGEVVSGRWQRRDDAALIQTLITPLQQWYPTLPEARRPDKGAQNAQFTIAIDPPGLCERAKEWVTDSRTAVADHVRGTLTGWLSGDAQAARAEQFAGLFEQALRSASPLVSVNPQAYREVHGDDPPRPVLIISPIPLAQDHPARQRVEAALLERGIQEGDLAAKFDPNAPVSEVEVMSFLGMSVHPVVFDSLMNPIHREWQSRTDPASRARFWKFRRARPLTSFIPLSPARTQMLTRGWLTADILGQVPVLEGSWSAAPLTVWSPRGNLRFPSQLLGREVTHHAEVLPALLEAVPLAFLPLSSGDTSEVAAYGRLIELGRSGDPHDSGYSRLNAELEQWVRSGTVRDADHGFGAAPQPPAEVAGSADDAPEARVQRIVATMRNCAQGYRDLVAGRQVTPETSLTLGRPWEAAEIIARAASDLADRLEETKLHPDSNGSGRGAGPLTS